MSDDDNGVIHSSTAPRSPEGLQPNTLGWDLLRRMSVWAFQRTVVVYYRTPTGNPVAYGTGVVLRIADETFLLTAGHVLQKRPEEAELLVGAAVEGSRMVAIPTFTGAFFEDVDVRDVGFIKLPPDVAARIGEHVTVLRLCELDLSQSLPDGAHLVAGYPGQLRTIDTANRTAVANRFAYLSHFTHVDDEVPGVTIALACRENILRHEDGTHIRRMPGLKAISGCGIWRAWAEHDPPVIGRWNESSIRLVGIEHGVTSTSIRGTIVGHVVHLIANRHPELREAIRIHRIQGAR